MNIEKAIKIEGYEVDRLQSIEGGIEIYQTKRPVQNNYFNSSNSLS